MIEMTFADCLSKFKTYMDIVSDKTYSIKERAEACETLDKLSNYMSGKRILDSADNAMITKYRGIRSLYLHANKNLVPMIEKEADNYIEKCNELINIINDPRNPFPERTIALQGIYNTQASNVYLSRALKHLDDTVPKNMHAAAQRYKKDHNKVKGLLVHMTHRGGTELSHNFEAYNKLKKYCAGTGNACTTQQIKNMLGNAFKQSDPHSGYPDFDTAYAELMEDFIPVRDSMRRNYRILRNSQSDQETKESAKKELNSLILELKPDWSESSARTKNWETEQKRMMSL